MLGNHVDDLPLSLQLAPTPDHIRRENEPALPFEQGRPNDQVRDVRLVLERDEQDAIGRARPLAHEHEPRDGHAAAIRRSAKIRRRHVAVRREVPSQERKGCERSVSPRLR